MQRIIIGCSLIALCTAVAVAQTPGKRSPSSKTGPLQMIPGGPGQTIPPGKAHKLPSGKQQTTPPPGASRRLVVPNQRLAITGGGTVNAVFDNKARTFRVNLRDGVYKTDNGGAIRVRNGLIVWDAFGAVERLKRGQGLAAGPTGVA